MSNAPFLSVHAISIFVRDQDASLRFYVDQLGFNLTFDAQLPSGNRWLVVAPPDGTTLLSLVAPKPDSKDYSLIGRSTGVAFVTEDVIAKFTEWSRRGVRFLSAPRLRRVLYERSGTQTPNSDPKDRVWGGVFAYFKDIDGNSFQLVGFDELNREIEAKRRQQAERLESERRRAQELEIAKQVQARLFPQTSPLISTLEYAGKCIQARQVGGDYFDFFELGALRFGFVIGDIAGKGMAAALLMANLQASLRIHCATAMIRPQHLLHSVNQIFYRNSTDSAYATLFFAEYDENSRRLQYVNCGHLPALLLRTDGTVERLSATATVLGLFEQWECSTEERELAAGDTLAIYTDGVTESFNDGDEEFGEDRLIEALTRNRHLSPQDIIAAVVNELQQFSSGEQQDDVTLIVAKCR